MVNLIAHGMIIKDEKILLIKRSKIKRGKPNYNPERFDIPGGTVECNENPRSAVVREIMEEVNCNATVEKIVYETYQYDDIKDKEFLTLIYKMKDVDSSNIKLDPEEHTEYRWVSITELLKPNFDMDVLEYVVEAVKELK